MSDLFWKLAINKIEKRVIKARHNHFTQVRNAAIVLWIQKTVMAL